MQFNLNTFTDNKINNDLLYDVIVLGGGPAGLNASIYAKRKGLSTLLITNKLGGQLENTSQVDNYLGFSNVDSSTLINNFTKHVQSLDVLIKSDVYVTTINKDKDIFTVTLESGETFNSKTIIYALGSFPRKLGLENEDGFNGISYCTVCDAPFYKSKEVAVVGGGNSALEAAIDLTHYANKVTIIQRSILRADQVLIDKAKNNPKIEMLLGTNVKSINGENKLESLTLINNKTNEKSNLNVGGLFIEIGNIPNTKLIDGLIDLDEYGSIITNSYQHTNLEGFYAAGDSTTIVHKQIIIAASQGAVAALEASKYLLNKKENI